MDGAKPYCSGLYGQLPETSTESARFTLFTRKTKVPKIMALPPTSPHLMLHLLRAHLQVMLAGRSLMESPFQLLARVTQRPRSLLMLFGVSVRHKARSAVQGPVDATENISHVQHIVTVVEKMAAVIPCTKFQEVEMLRWRLSNLKENLRRM